MTHKTWIILGVLSLLAFVNCASDVYGHNPQHEFGNVFSGGKSTPLLPFWELGGDALASENYVRLVPDRQSKKGSLWNTEPNKFHNWEVTFKFAVHGVSFLGADGFGFWYAKEKGLIDDFFGFTDMFAGLGVVFDTYDNDNTGLHPLLLGIVNDGTKTFSHEHDDEAHEEGGEMEVGNCQFHVRNSDEPSLIRVTYLGSHLKVEIALAEKDSFEVCFESDDVDLPTGYYFGFSAATGSLADNHDIHGVVIRNLDSNAKTLDNQRVYGMYDKYTVSEMLSKLHYAVTRLEEVVLDKTPGQVAAHIPTGNDEDLADKLDLLEDIGAAVLGVNDVVEDIKEQMTDLSKKNDGISTSLTSNTRSINEANRNAKDLAETVRQMERKLSSLETQISRDKKSSSKSSQGTWNLISTILMYCGIAIAVIVVIVIILVIIKVRRDKRRAHHF